MMAKRRYDRAPVKELDGAAGAVVAASAQECLTLLVAVDGYPSWYPQVVRDVAVLERDPQGRPSRARATLHVSVGPLVRDFNLLLAIAIEDPGTVKLTRVPNDPSDMERFEVTWRVDEAGETRLQLELHANLSVPRLLPLGGVGGSLAQGFVDAAARALAAR
jgi:hypothetical protein